MDALMTAEAAAGLFAVIDGRSVLHEVNDRLVAQNDEHDQKDDLKGGDLWAISKEPLVHAAP